MRIPILMYHSIANNDSDLSVSPINFEKQMQYLKKNNYRTINFDDLDKIDKNFKYIIITFDDGYKNLLIDALPILNKYKLTATCFFVTNYIGKYNIWDQNTSNFISQDLMNLDDIVLWKNSGMSLGCHTSSHLNLTKIDLETKNKEILTPKIFFEKNLSINVNCFSYPYGRYDNETINIVQKYYNYAVTTKRSRYKKDLFSKFELPRVPVNKSTNMFKFYLKIKTFYEDIKI